MGPEIELLRHHAEVGANPQHLFGIRQVSPHDLPGPSYRFDLEDYVTVLAVLQKVATPQKYGFSGSDEPITTRHPLVGGDIDTFQHVELAIRLMEVADVNHRLGSGFGHGTLF